MIKMIAGLSFICNNGSDMGYCQNKANTRLKIPLMKMVC